MPSFRFFRTSTTPPPSLRSPLQTDSMASSITGLLQNIGNLWFRNNPTKTDGRVGEMWRLSDRLYYQANLTGHSSNAPLYFGEPYVQGPHEAEQVQGAIFFYGGQSWSMLAPGTAGKVLTTGGAAADPSWTTITAGPTTTVKYKTANEDNTNAALQDDNDISLAVAASEVWSFEIFLAAGNVISSTTGFQMAFTVPAASTGYYTALMTATTGTSTGDYQTALTGVTSLTAGDVSGVRCRGVYVGGANAGTLQLQWSRTTASGTLTVFAGSYGVFTKLST